MFNSKFRAGAASHYALRLRLHQKDAAPVPARNTERKYRIEYRVSDCKIQKSIGVSISNTGIEESEYRISKRVKSIRCPALYTS
jgi:hypothetical protein